MRTSKGTREGAQGTMARRQQRGGKTGKKTGTMRSPRSGAEVPTGAHPKNTGGKKGRSGRPPIAFKMFLSQLRQDPKVQRQLQLTLLDRHARHYTAALKVLTDYDDQMPANLTPEERAARIEQFLRLARERAAAQGHT